MLSNIRIAGICAFDGNTARAMASSPPSFFKF